MHVELGGKVRVQNTIDVLEVGATRVFVQFVRLRIRSMEMTATSLSRLKEVKVLARD